ncbi:hypothetical protein C8T65DRAFT_701056 [Cerioporus squamosus]|nr:hypothetical protein C8T65DRAFT_701056 [Cerioporus squamosus]
MSAFPSAVSSMASQSPHASEPDGPWETDRGWDWMPTTHRRAYYYAESGNVCIGPVGMPVTGLDRLVLRAIQEEAPQIMEDWFEHSHGCLFYSSKLHVSADPSEELGPRYALFRSLVGPAILCTSRHVVGVPGSLYQKCSSYMEASLRLAQAWTIGGIVAKIPLAASQCPASTAIWLQGFAKSDRGFVRIEEDDAPDLRGMPYCTPDGVDEVLDEDLVTGGWRTYLPGSRPAREHSSGLLGTLPPPVSMTPTVPPDGEAEDSVTIEATSHAVGPMPPAAPSCSIREGVLATRHGGYFAVIEGENPEDIESWVPPEGAGHVGHYLTLRDALEAFQKGAEYGANHPDAITTALASSLYARLSTSESASLYRTHPLNYPPDVMGRRPKYNSDADRKAARRQQKARYAKSERGQARKAAARVRRAQAVIPPTITLGEIRLSDALREYAMRPFVMSFAFCDRTGPALGLHTHPFTFRMPEVRSLESLERRGGNLPLLVKLETLQFSWATQEASRRKREWFGKSDEEIANLGVRELHARNRAWTQMAGRTVRPGLEAGILDIAMRWGARLTVMLADEIVIRRQGREAWEHASERGELPLQKLSRENKERIEALPADDEDSSDDE